MSEKKIRACMVGMSGIALGRYPGYSLTAPEARYGPLNTEVPHSHVGAYSVLPQTDLVAVCESGSQTWHKKVIPLFSSVEDF